MFRRGRLKRFAPRLESLEGRHLLAAAPLFAAAANVGTVDPLIAVDHAGGAGGVRLTDLIAVDHAGGGGGVRLTVFSEKNGDYVPSQTITVTGVPAGRDVTLAAGDLNGDGLPDLAVAGPDGKGDIVVEPLLNNGQGSFAPITTTGGGPETIIMRHLPGPEKWGTLMLADLNGDHHADILYVSGDRLGYALSNAQGGYDAAQVVSNPLYEGGGKSGGNLVYEERIVGVADLDGDGPELIALSGNQFLTTSIGVSGASSAAGQTASTLDFGAIDTSTIPAAPQSGRPATAAFVADVNGDGLPDLVAVFGDKVFVGINGQQQNNGAVEHVFTWHVDSLPPTLAHQGRLFLGDVNGDGHFVLFAAEKAKSKSAPRGSIELDSFSLG